MVNIISSLHMYPAPKLLDWMQLKFRQTNNEPLTELGPRNSYVCLTGQPSLDNLQHSPKSINYAKAQSNTQRDSQFRKSFACIETARADHEQTEDESATDFSELFHGFLAIGTLAMENVTTEPVTTTFSIPVENIMGKQSDETENELKLNDGELVKVLEPEEKEDGAENSVNESVACPLQDYLFGSVVGVPETVTKKEHRTSLGELFQSTKIVEEITGVQRNKLENEKEKEKKKETEKSALHLMKKILKGRTLYSSSRRPTTIKKPRKIVQMLHRKVHPEGLLVAPKSENHSSEEYQNRNRISSEYITLIPMAQTSKKGAECINSYMPHSARCLSDSDGNRECWIKSDAEYLVLEL